MNSNLYTKILSAEDIQQIVHNVGMDKLMDELIERTYHAFVEFDPQQSMMPARSGFNYEKPAVGLIEWMPLRDVGEEEVVMKMVAYHPQNPINYELPTILATIAKYDTKTGHLKVLMDGVLPTSLRTGAASAVASKLFGHKESRSLGLIGCGAQAVTQLHALSRVFDLDTVMYFDTDETTFNSFEQRVKVLGLRNVTFMKQSIDEIVKTVDILSTATSIGVGEGPLFEFESAKKWLHINAIGSDFAGKIELPKKLLEQSYVAPDMLEQAIIEGECQQLASDQIGNDLITCLKTANQYNHLKEEKTVFDSTGIPLEDKVVADLLMSYADKLGLGTSILLENTNCDEKNPYSFLMKLVR